MEDKSIEVDYLKIIDAVNEIENLWYMKDPGNTPLTSSIQNWLDKYKKKPPSIELDGISQKQFVRAYTHAYQNVFNNHLKQISELIKFKKSHILSCEEVALQILEDFHDKRIVLKIGESEFTISATLKTVVHLGNGKLRDVGTYQEIFSFLALVTDCDVENNKVLAELFLDFAKGAFEFEKKHLIKINKKFKLNAFKSLIKGYCAEITHIAVLFVLFEPARRIEVVKEKEKFVVRKNQDSLHAISSIVALKLLRDGEIELGDVFSSRSTMVFFTRTGVNDYLNKSSSEAKKARGLEALETQKNTLAAEAVSSAAECKGGFFYQLNKAKELKGSMLKKYILDPHEDESSESDNEDTYEVETKRIAKHCFII